MKKAVSLFLTAAMLLSFMLITSAENYSTAFCLCDTLVGWNAGFLEQGVDENSMACIKATAQNGTNMVISYNHPSFVDMNGSKFIEFDWYIGNVAVLSSNAQMQMEITSSGQPDVEEATWTLDDFSAMNLVNGWNHIKLNLEGKGANTSHINFFRFYMLNISLPDGEAVEIKFDDMYVTDGNGAVERPLDDIFQNNYIAPSDFGKDVSSCLQYGDLDGSNGVDISDAMKAFKYVAGKEDLDANALLAANVNAQTGVSLCDAMQIFLNVAGKSDEMFLTEKAWQGEVETGVLGAHLVKTAYKTTTPVVAVCDVAAFGAYGDGVHDDTNAFNYALTYAQLNGNGTVFVPAGKYKVSENISIPAGVTLCGDKPFNKDMQQSTAVTGTVLCAYAGRGDADGTAFITLGYGSGLKNLSIWYPEQTVDNITEYPYTISKIGTSCLVSNVCLVNSYNGIYNGGVSNALQNYEYICGTILNRGIFINNNYDLCRVENICFSPDFWADCGLGAAQDKSLIESYVYQNATAIEAQRLDWTYFMGITVSGFKCALHTTKGENGTTNGHLYDFNFSGCQTGVYFEYMSSIGYMMTCGIIAAENPVVVADTFGESSATFKNVSFSSSKNACVSGGKGNLVFDDCLFDGSAEAIKAPNMTVSALDCTFAPTLSGYIDAQNASKVINPSCDTVKMAGDCAEMKLVYDENEHTADVNVNDVDSKYIYYSRPTLPNFIDLSKDPYNISSSSADVSAQLQKAIDDIYEMGGGIVYLGCGTYRLENKITLRPGVELRGSSDGPSHSSSPATLFLTDFGKSDKDGEALFNLEEYSTIRGFQILYDKQGDNIEKNVSAYSYTIRASGTNITVYAVSIHNPYRGADFATNRCDNHYVKNFDCAPFRNGITVGGESRNGIVRDCHFNPHYNSVSSVDAMWKYQIDYNEGFVVKETQNEVLVQNFVFGAVAGLVLSDGAQVYSIGHGTDGGTVGITFRGKLREGCTFVDSQLAIVGTSSYKYYINCEGSMEGRASLLQTCMWGNPTFAVQKAAGDLIMSTGIASVCGSAFLVVRKGSSAINGLCLGSIGSPIFNVRGKASTVCIFGNIVPSTSTLLSDPYDVVTGSDKN